MPKYINAQSSVRSLVREGRGKQKSKNKKSRFLNILILLILLTVLSFILYYGYLFLSAKPHSTISEDRLSHILVSREGVTSTLVVLESSEEFKIQGAWYVVNNPRNASVFVYYIPPGVYVKDYLNKISEFVSSGDLKYIGDSISQNRAVEYSIWQLGNLTGITPDSYIWISHNSLVSFTNLFGSPLEYSENDIKTHYSNSEQLTSQSFIINSLFNKLNPLPLFLNDNENSNFIKGIDTNLNGTNLYSRLWEIKNALQLSNIYMLDLGQTWATSTVVTTSGRTINLINYDEVDKRLATTIKELKGRDIEKEQVKIEIYNASEIDGLASRYSRKFQNAGIEVVRYENAPIPQDNTVIYVPKPEKFSSSLSLVKKLIVIDTNVIENRPDFMTTGDIVIILGKDMKIEALWQ